MATAGAGGGTREQVVRATLDTLRRHGLKNASTRAIARAGGFNPALIFYYFGSLDGALLAALDEASAASMARWTAAIEGAADAQELLAAAAALYRQDVASGHTTVVAELIGAAHARPELRPQITARFEPWLELAESVIRRLLAGSPLASAAPARDLASAAMAMALGANLFTYLDQDQSRVQGLLDLAERLSPLLDMLLPGKEDDG
jgi:AcrR family transcriptional regulator